MAKNIIKSASKKRGTLMETVTDPNYGKDTRGEAKDKVFMGNNPSGLRPTAGATIIDANGNEIKSKPVEKKEERMTEAEFRMVNEAMKAKIQEIKDYNNNLYELDKKYTSLKTFNGGILVRLKRIPTYREVEVAGEVSEIYIPVHAVKPSMADPHGREGIKVEHPFPYTNVGVVVSSDSPKLQVGDTVQLTRKSLSFHWSPVEGTWEWPQAFYHHNDGIEFQGYVLLREYDIEAKLNERV